MYIILSHFQACHSFTIDTEAVDRPSNLALIQVQSIPVELPSYVLLIQLHHLPKNDSLLFKKIQSLFKILFDTSKTIYSWGPLGNEIKYATRYSLFIFPIHAKAINLQLEFNTWHRWVPPFCEVCKPDNNTYVTVGTSAFCKCRRDVSNGPPKLWSLQNAVLYTANCFLDKSQTESDWFAMLDPKNTSLPSLDLDKMIKYAIYDCLSVTYLRLPIMQRWSLIQLEKTPIHILLTDTKHIIADPDLEYVSEDELPQVIQPLLFNNNEQQQQQRTDEVTDQVSTSEQLMERPSSLDQKLSILNTNSSKKHSQRSAVARARRNRKRPISHRIRRYEYRLVRSLYYLFTLKMIKKVLNQLEIQFTHVKCDNYQLIIGINNKKLKRKFEQLLPLDTFDRDHYYSY